MANKRDLKRTINYTCSDLFAECIAASLYSGKPVKDDVDALLKSILMVHNQFIRRVSHPEPGMEQKKYYQNLAKEFDKSVAEIVDQIANIY
jgi:hypothetical protein